MKQSLPLSHFSLNCNGKLIDLSRPKLMGILNVTPDSFSDGGKHNEQHEALKHAEKLILEGADIIDIGAQSTRPNAEYLSAAEEIRRIGSLIKMIKREFPDVLISVDTFYGDVVRFAKDEGMDIVNDISGGQFDKDLIDAVVESRLPYVLMHVNSSYDTMHDKTVKGDMVVEINRYFSEKIEMLLKAGVHDIILDPGFGFGKTVEQQYDMIDRLEQIGFNKFPSLIGISRKSFIYKPLGKLPNEVQEETQALHKKILLKGGNILRVHDVAATKLVLDELV